MVFQVWFLVSVLCRFLALAGRLVSQQWHRVGSAESKATPSVDQKGEREDKLALPVFSDIAATRTLTARTNLSNWTARMSTTHSAGP